MRIPPAVSAKLAAIQRLAKRRVLAQRLRWIAKRPDWALANEAFAEIRAHYSDLDGAAVLASALLQNARHAEAGRRWAHAARYWVWYAAVSGDVTKSSRNLVQCARSPTKVRHDREAVLQSLCIWQLLAALDPRSDEARQGIVWCHASLARRAEEQGDFATAQDQWSKVLEVAPSDPSATEGLQRVLEWRKKRAGSPESRSAAQALYGRLKQRTRPDYKSQVAAGFRMLHAGAPDLALDFAEAALRRNRGGEASILYLQCCVALERYGEAATVLGSVTDDAKAAALPAMDVQELLTHIPQDLLPLEFVAGLAQRADAGAFASVLLPILIQHDLKLAVFRLAEKTTRIPPITAPIILQVADYLWRMGEEGRTVEFLAGLSRDPAAADLFQHYASHLSAERLEQILLPSTGEQHGGEIWLTLAEYHHRQGDVHRATETLHRGVKEGELPRRFYGDNKSRIASLVLGLLDNGGESLEIPERLADVIAQWALPQVKAFFSSPEFSDLCQELAENSRFAIAPEHSRLGSLREGYFEYHMERRENRSPESYETDFAICEAALEYFDTLARMRPAEQVPVSAALRARLATTGFSLGSGSADAMMSYAILRDRPHCDLVSSSLFDEMAAWYVTEFASRNKIPSCCMSAAVTASLNAADHAFARVGTVVTRFAGTLRQQSEVWKDSYDPANPLDTLLFSLELVASVLPLHPNYRFLIGNMLPATDAVAAFADLCIAALAGRNGELDVPFSALLNQRAIPTRPVPVRTGGMHAPQDVLLIGHGSEGTGLGRNTRMLAEGLQAAGVGLSMLSYESPAEEFSRDLLRWWNRCETDPIVVAAVNAQDVPTLFVKDGHNILDRCHVAGFFLWETSKAPRIQHLGIRLVNEIWVPTHYVGSVYAPYAPVHVIGKGLFSGAESAKPQLPPSAPVRFLTVFDFHSSIERKNPVASVVAFQKAFTAGENVELIVKASNVNPQHPGNIFAQWERLCAASKGDPRIRIIVERYSEEQMRELLLVASCIVSLHRAEGFGYILSDAMALGIPVVATGYSGNTDFCSAETSFPVSYRLVPVKSSGAHWEDEGTEWAEPDIDSAVAQMRAVYCDYPAALKKAAAAAAAIRSQYSVERFSGTLRARLAAIRKDAGVDPASVIVQ